MAGTQGLVSQKAVLHPNTSKHVYRMGVLAGAQHDRMAHTHRDGSLPFSAPPATIATSSTSSSGFGPCSITSRPDYMIRTRKHHLLEREGKFKGDYHLYSQQYPN